MSHAVRPSLWPLRDAALVAGAALGLRVLTWALYSGTPFFHVPVVDASTFDIWAQQIAAGRIFQPDVYFKPPLYPYFLGALYQIFGRSLPVVYGLQAVLGTASSLLVLALGRLYLPPRVALAAGIIAGLLPIPAFLELQLLAEPLTTFLCLAALLLFMLATREAEPEEHPSVWRLLLAGALFGVAALGRPNLLIVPPVLALWIVLGGALKRQRDASTPGPGGRGGRPRRSGKQPAASRRRLRLAPAALLLAGTLLAIAPVTLRNLRVGHAFVPISAGLGANLWTGNNPMADGVSPVPVGIRWEDLQLHCRQAGAAGVTGGSRLLTREALAWMAGHPGRTLGLIAKKAVVLLNGIEVRNNIGPRFLARQGVITLRRWWPGFWLVAPLAILGLAGLRRRGRPVVPLVLFAGSVALSLLPFFVNARFRAPLLPVLSLLAADGAAFLHERWRVWRDGSRSFPLAPVLLLVASCVLVNVDWFDLDRPELGSEDEANLASILARGYDGVPPRPAAAARHYAAAMALDGADPDPPERYGQLLLSAGQPLMIQAEDLAARQQWSAAVALADSAVPMLRQAAELHARAARLMPRSFRSLANRGTAVLWLADGRAWRVRIQLLAGDTTAAGRLAEGALQGYLEAAILYQRALDVYPAFAEARANLARAAERITELPPLTPEIRRRQAQAASAATRSLRSQVDTSHFSSK